MKESTIFKRISRCDVAYAFAISYMLLMFMIVALIAVMTIKSAFGSEMTTANEFLRASDNATDHQNSLIEGLESKAITDIGDLYRDVGNRDGELWDEIEIDGEVTSSDYDDIEIDNRDLAWVAGLASISAASTTQFFLENREDTLIKPLSYREQVVGALVVSKTALIQAGKRRIEFVSDATYKRIQEKYINRLTFMRDLTNTQLHRALTEAGALQPVDKLIADSTGYVSRMTNYRPGSPQFQEAVQDLVNKDSTRGLKAMNRRSVETLYTAREVDGDVNRLLVWIVEFGAGTCSYCLARAGQVMTYQEWVDNGLPGADVCKGGNLCNCHLEAV